MTPQQADHFIGASRRGIDPAVVAQWMGRDWHAIFYGPLWFWMEQHPPRFMSTKEIANSRTIIGRDAGSAPDRDVLK